MCIRIRIYTYVLAYIHICVYEHLEYWHYVQEVCKMNISVYNDMCIYIYMYIYIYIHIYIMRVR